MKIALLAGEISADIIGANLIERILQRFPHAQIVGMGGSNMLQAGQTQWFDNSAMAIMGFSDAIKNLSVLLKLRQQFISKALSENIDLFIGIDAPDFNFGVEKALRPHLPTLHYVSPSIWAWRTERVHKIARCCQHIFCLFPFEPKLYEQAQLSASFVGHPMAQSIPLHTDTQAARTLLHLTEQHPIIAMLPGSRKSEILRNLPILIHSLQRYHNHSKTSYHCLIPCAHPHLMPHIEAIIQTATAPLRQNIRVLNGHARTILQACDAAMVASGTATLETLLLKKPMLVVYKVSPINALLLGRMLKTPWVSLPNALANQFIVPEFLQQQAQSATIGDKLYHLLHNPTERQAQIQHFDRIHHMLIAGSDPIDTIAHFVNH